MHLLCLFVVSVFGLLNFANAFEGLKQAYRLDLE